MEKTEGIVPINYEFWQVGPKGARFAIYPVDGEHSEEDVKIAKRWLHNNQDVVSLQVRWVKPNDDTDHPEKIPDYLIIKNLKIEMGKRDSEILELQDQLKKLSDSTKEALTLNREERNSLKKDEHVKDLRRTIAELENKLGKCKKDNEQLIIRMNRSVQKT